MKQRLMTAALAVVMGVGGVVATGGVAEAARRTRANSREKAWRIGTYAGTAATTAALVKGKGTWALIGGGATALSYSQWRKEMKRRHKKDRSRAAYQRYLRSRRARR